jgi:hypothetical protein
LKINHQKFGWNKKGSYFCNPFEKTGGKKAKRSLKVWKQQHIFRNVKDKILVILIRIGR